MSLVAVCDICGTNCIPYNVYSMSIMKTEISNHDGCLVSSSCISYDDDIHETRFHFCENCAKDLVDYINKSRQLQLL